MPPRPEPNLAPALAAFALACLACGCEREREVFRPAVPRPPVARETGAIHVGVVASLSGRDATSGLAEWRGTALAVEERNAGARTQGREVQLALLDDRGTSAGAAAAGARFATSERVVLVLGGTRGERTLAAAQAAEGIPVAAMRWEFTYARADLPVQGTGPFARDVANACARLEPLRAAAATKGRGIEVLTRAGAPEEDFTARALVGALTGAFGAEHVARHDVSASDPTERIAAWSARPPGAVVLAFDGLEATRVVATARKRGRTDVVFVVVGEPELASVPRDSTALVDDTIALTTFDRDAERAFTTSFRARFGAEPDERAWRGFAQASAVLDALACATTFSPADVRQRLAALPLHRPEVHALRVRDGRLVPLSAATN